MATALRHISSPAKRLTGWTTYHQANLHRSSSLGAISPLRMPALSPTMETGQIANWNVQRGDRFSAGDVLLTVETDKASVDVEAQDDGYMGLQLLGPGTGSEVSSIKVGQLIAVLGEAPEDVEGSVEVPDNWVSEKEGLNTPPKPSHAQASPGGAQTPQQPRLQGHPNQSSGLSPKTSLPLSPAVSRLLTEYRIEDLNQIKGSGLHGRLTKGDVLAHLGKASSAHGSALKMMLADRKSRLSERSKNEIPREQSFQISGCIVRQSIAEGLFCLTRDALASHRSIGTLSFDSVLGDYESKVKNLPPRTRSTSWSTPDSYFHGLTA